MMVAATLRVHHIFKAAWTIVPASQKYYLDRAGAAHTSNNDPADLLPLTQELSECLEHLDCSWDTLCSHGPERNSA